MDHVVVIKSLIWINASSSGVARGEINLQRFIEIKQRLKQQQTSLHSQHDPASSVLSPLHMAFEVRTAFLYRQRNGHVPHKDGSLDSVFRFYEHTPVKP